MPKGSYVIGSTDGALESRSHLYDVVANGEWDYCRDSLLVSELVNYKFAMSCLPLRHAATIARTGAITVSPQAVEDFALGRVHKNIATEMLEMLKQTSSSDADLMKVRTL